MELGSSSSSSSCSAAEARIFWLRQEQRGRQPRQPLADRPPTADGACGAGEPHCAGVRVGRAGFRFGHLAPLCAHELGSTDLAALTARTPLANRAAGAAGGRESLASGLDGQPRRASGVEQQCESRDDVLRTGASEEDQAASAAEQQGVSVGDVLLRERASDEGLAAGAEQCVSVVTTVLREGASDDGLAVPAVTQCVSACDVLHHGDSDEGLECSTVEQFESVTELPGGASDEGLASCEREQCVSADVLQQHQDASDEGLGARGAVEQCASVGVLTAVAGDEGLDGRRGAAQRGSASTALRAAPGLPLMRLPRGRLRWADSEDGDEDVFDSPTSSSAASVAEQGSSDALHGAARIDAMGAMVAQAMAAQQSGQPAASLELAVQACVVVATGRAEFETRVSVAEGGYRATVDLAITLYEGPVRPTAGEARYSALRLALNGLLSLLHGLRRRLAEDAGSEHR